MKRTILGVSIVLAAVILGGCEQKAAEQPGTVAPETAANPNAALTQQEDWTTAGTDQGATLEEGLTGEGAALPPETTAGQASSGFVKPTVEEIQQALKNLSLYQGNIDGKLGPKTKQAIKDFQVQSNLTADGKVGPKTWAQLAPYLNNSAVTDTASVVISN